LSLISHIIKITKVQSARCAFKIKAIEQKQLSITHSFLIMNDMQDVFYEVFLSSQCIFAKGKTRLERANVVKEELNDQDTRFLAVYVEAKNSCLVLLSEKEDKMGTMAIAVPKANEYLGTASSSVLVGNKNIISARMFAEYIATKKGKIAMVSVYLEKFDEMQAQKFFMKLIEKVMQNQSKKEPTTT